MAARTVVSVVFVVKPVGCVEMAIQANRIRVIMTGRTVIVVARHVSIVPSGPILYFRVTGVTLVVWFNNRPCSRDAGGMACGTANVSTVSVVIMVVAARAGNAMA